MKLFAPLCVWATAVSAVLVPGPPGQYGVAMKVQSLTDPSRNETLDPLGKGGPRRVLVSAFLPVHPAPDGTRCTSETAAYMPPATASHYDEVARQLGFETGIFSSFEFQLCNLDKLPPGCKRPHHRDGSVPVVVFSTGFGTSRLLYGARARSLASQGYAVVTIDHPYDADIVEFPDGTVIPAANISEENIPALYNLVEIRTADLSFVLDQLHNETITKSLLHNYPGSLDLQRVAAFGHSMGGASSAAAAAADERILGGLNFDGGLIGPAESSFVERPFVLAGRQYDAQDPWDQFWSRLRGPRAEVTFANTKHGSFTDVLTLLSAVDVPEAAKPAIQEQFGSVQPDIMENSMNGLLQAFLKLSFKGDESALKHIGAQFPEIGLVRSEFKK